MPPQFAHSKFWSATSSRIGWGSMTVSLMGLLHFGQDSSTNNVKGIVSSFRARRTEDTQKGPGKIVRVRGALRWRPVEPMVPRYGSNVERFVRNSTDNFLCNYAAVIRQRSKRLSHAAIRTAPISSAVVAVVVVRAAAAMFRDVGQTAVPYRSPGRTPRMPIASVRRHIECVRRRVLLAPARVSASPDLAIGPRPTWDTRAPPCQHPTLRKVASAGQRGH